MRKIGLFGGTFDPPHRTHIRMAQAFATQIGLDEVVLIPAGDPYHKPQAAPVAARHRLAMCRLAASADARLAVSDIDMVRQGATYTYDTVSLFRQHDPGAQWWWLIGSDSLRQLPTWYRYRDLLRLVNIAVVWRDGDEADNLPADIAALVAEGTQAAAEDAAVGQIRFLDVAREQASSTAIRQKLRAGAAVDDLLDKTVSAYIRRHRLYTD